MRQPYKVYTINLTEAGSRFIIEMPGNYVRFLSCDEANFVMTLRYDSGDGDAIPFAVGQGSKGLAFNKLILDWPAAATAGSKARIAVAQASGDFEAFAAEAARNVIVANADPIAVSGAVTVSGTASVTQGTTPWITAERYIDPASVQFVKVGGGTNNTAYQTIHTVTAEKELYWRKARIHTAGGAGWNVGAYAAITDGDDNVLHEWYTHDTNGVNLEIGPVGPIPAGHKIKIKAGSGQVCTFSADAYEVAA